MPKAATLPEGYIVYTNADWSDEVAFCVGNDQTEDDLSTLTGASLTLTPPSGSRSQTARTWDLDDYLTVSGNAILWSIDKAIIGSPTTGLAPGYFGLCLQLNWADGTDENVLIGRILVVTP